MSECSLIGQFLKRRGHDDLTFSEAWLEVDHVYGHDRNFFKIADELKLTGTSIFSQDIDASLLRLFTDHYSPPPDEETAGLHALSRSAARTHGINLFDVGSGVGHQLALEHFASPGDVAVGVDSHTCTVGALGALGLRQPPVAVAAALRTRQVRFDYARPLGIHLTGTLREECCAKDIGLSLASFGGDIFRDRLLEFGGPGLASLSVADRATLANLSTDLLARSALFEVDETTLLYLREMRGSPPPDVSLRFDPAAYADSITIDLGRIEPMIAPPPLIWEAIPVARLSDAVEVDVVALGSCTNGRFQDMAEFLAEMGDGAPARRVRLIVTPASRSVLAAMLDQGLYRRFIDLGAIINPPGCGPCMGLHQGLLADGDVCVATGSRNNPGRMGARGARVYLSGPKVAAQAARHGRIGAREEMEQWQREPDRMAS